MLSKWTKKEIELVDEAWNVKSLRLGITMMTTPMRQQVQRSLAAWSDPSQRLSRNAVLMASERMCLDGQRQRWFVCTDHCAYHAACGSWPLHANAPPWCRCFSSMHSNTSDMHTGRSQMAPSRGEGVRSTLGQVSSSVVGRLHFHFISNACAGHVPHLGGHRG